MWAMVLNALGKIEPDSKPLTLSQVPMPQPAAHEVLVKVSACAVCHTELDEIEGRTPPRLPVIPGHQVVGRVVACGSDVNRFKPGERVGIAWIYSACGHCELCREGRENLCRRFQATGRDTNGGYGQYMVVAEDFAYAIPAVFSDVQAAPLLCAGAIGYRSLRLAQLEDGQTLGLTGFGASAHLVLKMVRHRYPGCRVFVFARKAEERAFALELGATWAGTTTEAAPELLHAIIDTTPAWAPIVESLKNLRPGGRLVVNAIRKEEADKAALLALDYPRDLWQEKTIQSVANVARSDVIELLQLAAEIPLLSEVEAMPFQQANRALVELKFQRVKGAKVLVFDSP